MSTVVVIDYGMGNLHSVAKALEHVAGRTQVQVSHDPEVIRAADRVVLPGVGAIRDCIGEIRRLGIDRLVQEALSAGKPFLGVCVGLQALMSFSDENNGVTCLDILPGRVKFFGDTLHEPGQPLRLKIPHMGWNEVQQTRPHPLWQSIEQNSRFYFVHSYYVQPQQPDSIAGRCHYGLDFAVALARGNLFAVQFHPEKSQHAGLTLYENFLRWDGRE